MIRFQTLPTAILTFCCVFSNRMNSVQQTIGASQIQTNDDLERMISEQQYINDMQSTFLSLVSSRTRKLEDKYNMLLGKTDICEGLNVEIQNLTARMNQLQNLESVVTNMISKIDKIEEEMENITRNEKCVGTKWESYKGMKYYFSNKGVPWQEAQMNCHKLEGSHLVSIPSADVNLFLIRKGNNGQYWTGGNDRQREGRWVWDYQQVRVSYTDWRRGEPNNAGSEHCMVLFTDPSKPRHWNDAKCELYLRYICQKIDK